MNSVPDDPADPADEAKAEAAGPNQCPTDPGDPNEEDDDEKKEPLTLEDLLEREQELIEGIEQPEKPSQRMSTPSEKTISQGEPPMPKKGFPKMVEQVRLVLELFRIWSGL